MLFLRTTQWLFHFSFQYEYNVKLDQSITEEFLATVKVRNATFIRLGLYLLIRGYLFYSLLSLLAFTFIS